MEKSREKITGPLDYHRHGLRLVPLSGKTALLKGWPELRLSEEEILEWDGQGVNWGAVTGEPLVVIDVDNEAAQKRARQLGINSSVEVQSGGNGRHYWFLKPENCLIIRSRNGLHGVHGLDLKGHRGYIVLPGSVHPVSGRRYMFVVGKEFQALHLLPEFNLAWSRETPRGYGHLPRDPFNDARNSISGDIRDVMAYIMAIPSVQGQNGSNAAYRVACLLYDSGKSFDQILAAMEQWNEVCAFPRWSRPELIHKIESVFRRKQAIS